MKHRIPFLLSILAFSTALPAQQSKKLTARNFHIDDHRTMLRVDMKALRDTGVWDELQAGGGTMLAQMFVTELGFEIDALDLVTMTRRLPKGGEQAPPVADGEPPESIGVVVLEGNAPLGDLSSYDSDRYSKEQVGGYTLYLDDWSGDATAQPVDTLMVTGSAQLIRDVLEGRPRSGLPSADVMAFTAGKQRALVDVVLDLAQEPALEAELVELLPKAGAGGRWPEGDAPSMIGLRVLATGDEDDRHLELELVVRHGTAGAGLAATERAVAAGIEALKTLKEARLFRPLLKEIEHERSGTDAVWRVDLGRARQFGGSMLTLMPLVAVGFQAYRIAQEMQVAPGAVLQVVEEVEVEAVEEPPPPPPPEGGGGGGGGGQRDASRAPR